MINKIENDLKNKQNYGKLNYEGFKTEFEKEVDYPVQIKNNSPWVKELYGKLKESQKLASPEQKGIFSTKLLDFEKEADEIYKLDTAKQNDPAIGVYDGEI